VNLFALSITLIGLACALAWGEASAQSAIAASQEAQRRQQEVERLLREQLERTPDVHLPRPSQPEPAPPQDGPDTPCFPIHTIALRASTVDSRIGKG